MLDVIFRKIFVSEIEKAALVGMEHKMTVYVDNAKITYQSLICMEHLMDMDFADYEETQGINPS